MGKRKREDDDDEYVGFCSGLQRNSQDGLGDNSYVYSASRPYKRPKINPNFYTQPRVHYSAVDPCANIYREIKSMITNRSFVVDEIIRVRNSVLEDAYYLKKRQKMQEYGGEVEEALLFHGTKEANLASICTFNFDWRLTGRNKGHKFGKGVNFSPNAKYASNYSDHNSYHKVMIVAKVLIGKVCKGHHDMTIPPKGFDTSAKDKGIVLVKYEDNEFFPAYILRYHFRGNEWMRERPHHRQRNHDGYDRYSHGHQGYGYSFDHNDSALISYHNFYYGIHQNNNQHYLKFVDQNSLNVCLNQLNTYLNNSQNYSDQPSSDYSSDGNYNSCSGFYSFT